MKTRSLRADEVFFKIEAEDEDIPVRGNAMCSGDDDADRECEDEIIARLDRGDVWAWCCVKVTATWNGWKGVAYLGACSYEDQTDFEAGGYWDDMKHEALNDLNRSIASAANELQTLETP